MFREENEGWSIKQDQCSIFREEDWFIKQDEWPDF